MADVVYVRVYPPSYSKLAQMMSMSKATAIFRRFDELNMITLMRLQAELHDLERQLQDVRIEDSHNDIAKFFAVDFKLMRNNVVEENSKQHDLLIKISDKLGVYSKFG